MERPAPVAETGQQLSQRIRVQFCTWGARTANQQFVKTGNPLFAWNAVMNSLAGGLELPDETKMYLRRVSRILGNSRQNPSDKKDIADFVKRALELSPKRGGPSYFKQRATLERNTSIVTRASLLARDAGNEKTNFWDALERAAEDATISPEAVQTYFKRKKLK